MRMMEIEDEHSGQEFFSEEEDGSGVDSDEELQAAFARGDLKPGLVVLGKPEGASEKKPLVINNVPVMELKLQQIKLSKQFGWVERLDIVNGMAPLAPEIALQVDEHKTKREREIKSANAAKSTKKTTGGLLKSVEEDPVHNDFVREMNFYRQAQEAVLKCVPRLHGLGVPTKRPEDYFAEMAKSDTHMQKVAKVLHKQTIISERAEKIRKVRQQKKIAKQTQVHVLQEKQKAKRELMENVKKYRKGQKNSLDFLEDNKPNGKSGKGKPTINRKRLMKNERYGYGGKKKGSKYNTRESLDSFDDGSGQRGKSKRGGFVGAGGPKVRGKGFSSMRKPGNRRGGSGGKRPGKNTRQKNKAKRN